MHLDDGGVHFDGLDLDAHDLLALQLFKDAIQYAVLGPAVHAGVNGVPVAEPLGKPPPLAPLLGHIQNRVQHREVRQAHVAALTRKAGLDASVLHLCNLHQKENTTKILFSVNTPGLRSQVLVRECAPIITTLAAALNLLCQCAQNVGGATCFSAIGSLSPLPSLCS